jgi:hypothetical protein
MMAIMPGGSKAALGRDKRPTTFLPYQTIGCSAIRYLSWTPAEG